MRSSEKKNLSIFVHGAPISIGVKNIHLFFKHLVPRLFIAWRFAKKSNFSPPLFKNFLKSSNLEMIMSWKYTYVLSFHIHMPTYVVIIFHIPTYFILSNCQKVHLTLHFSILRYVTIVHSICTSSEMMYESRVATRIWT